MKLGSANKWIELLRATAPTTLNDGMGLHWCDETFSPVGVLENFISREWRRIEFIGCYANIADNINIASKDCLDKCKCKTNLEMIDVLWAKVRDIDMLCFLIGYNQETL